MTTLIGQMDALKWWLRGCAVGARESWAGPEQYKERETLDSQGRLTPPPRVQTYYTTAHDNENL